MKISHDYEELINELEEEIEGGMLKLSDTIQVLRGEPRYGYAPIIDWYYDHERSMELFEEDDEDSITDMVEQAQIKKQYEEDRPHLEQMTVEEALGEMLEMDKVI